MRHDVRDRKPACWLLSTITLLLGSLLWRVETSVSGGAARLVLEGTAVCALFAAMILWVPRNRVVVEDDEKRRRLTHGVRLEGR